MPPRPANGESPPVEPLTPLMPPLPPLPEAETVSSSEQAPANKAKYASAGTQKNSLFTPQLGTGAVRRK